MIVIHGETNDGKRRLIVVQLDQSDVKGLVFQRGAISINSDVRENFPADLELMITAIDITELVALLNAAGAVQFKGTDEAGRRILG